MAGLCSISGLNSLQTNHIFRSPPGMDTERGQHQVTLVADFETAFI